MTLDHMIPTIRKFSLLITLPTRRAINTALKTVRNRALVMTQQEHEGQRVYELINNANAPTPLGRVRSHQAWRTVGAWMGEAILGTADLRSQQVHGLPVRSPARDSGCQVLI